MENERTFDETFDEVLSALLALIQQKKYKEARDLLLTGHNGADVAELMEGIVDEEGRRLHHARCIVRFSRKFGSFFFCTETIHAIL